MNDLLLNEHGCITVKEQAGYLVELVPMIYNWRVVLTPADDTYGWDFGWCYFGTDRDTFARAWLAAERFDLETMAEPEGFDKRVGGLRELAEAS